MLFQLSFVLFTVGNTKYTNPNPPLKEVAFSLSKETQEYDTEGIDAVKDQSLQKAGRNRQTLRALVAAPADLALRRAAED